MNVFCCMLILWCLKLYSGSYANNVKSVVEEPEPGPHEVVHSRKKRYVVFPEGSTITLAACVSPMVLTEANGIFSSGIAWALSYDLPNETIHTKDYKNKFPVMIRRHKRNLFVRMEKLIDSSGFDGKNCVLKTICETSQQLVPRKGVLEEIFRLIFLYPPAGNTNSVRQLGALYENAHTTGESNENCQEIYPCPISFLQMGLGYGTEHHNIY